VEFLKGLFRLSNVSQVHSEIAGEVELTRFVYERSKIRPDGSLKERAFRPDKDNETSVFVFGSMSRDQILSHEEKYGRPERMPRAYGSTTTKFVASINLRTFHAEPPPKHAAIRDWPEESELRLQLAQLLAGDASKRGPVIL